MAFAFADRVRITRRFQFVDALKEFPTLSRRQCLDVLQHVIRIHHSIDTTDCTLRSNCGNGHGYFSRNKSQGAVAQQRELAWHFCNRVNGLLLMAGSIIFFLSGKSETFQVLLARRMKRKPFEEVATSPEPGAITPSRGERRC
jgi:hypothetical protein